jgi:hypothetical protein
MSVTRIVLAAAAAVSLSACATVTRGTNTAWVVETTPAGASVQTTNGFSCPQTPCTFKMPRKSEFGVTITKEGYKTHTSNVTNKVSGGGGAAMAGNVLVGGLIGAGIDAGSGAMLDLVPNPLVVTLEPVAPPAPPAPAAEPTPAPAPTTQPSS